MSSKSKHQLALSWASIALYATVFLPSFASGMDRQPAPVTSDQFQRIFAETKTTPDSLREQYKGLSLEALEQIVCKSRRQNVRDLDTLDLKIDTFNDLYKHFVAIFTAPEIKAIMQALLKRLIETDIAEKELHAKKQQFSPRSSDHTGNHEL